MRFQDQKDGGDQLPVRAQEAPLQAPGPRPHPRDHPTRQLHWHLPGGLHGRSRLAEAGGNLQVLASLPQPEEADRGEVLPPEPQHDDATTPQALPVARRDKDEGATQDEGGRHP